MSHVSPRADEGCGVICFFGSRRRILCHMFRRGLKKAVVSHVSSVVEEECCVACFVSTRRRTLCHMFRRGLKKAVVSHVSSVVQEECCVTCSVCNKNSNSSEVIWSSEVGSEERDRKEKM